MRLDPRTVSTSVAATLNPVSIDEIRDHIRQDDTTDDTYLSALIDVAVEYCESVSMRSFVNRTLVGGLDGWPLDDVIELPHPPLVSVTSIAYVDKDGNSSTLASSVYGVDTRRDRIYLAEDQVWPSTQLRTYDPITVTWVAGYGATANSVPDKYKHAIKFMIGHWYENREEIVALQGIGVAAMPLAASSLLMLDRAY